MSEHITHTVVQDDCVRIARHAPAICDAFKHCLTKHADIARMGAVTISGDKFTVKLLTEARERWAKRKPGDLVEEKLAFVLGWRCHLAADRQFKPIYRQLDPEHYANNGGKVMDDGPSDVSIMHDVMVYREIYGSGTEDPFSPASMDFRLESHPAAQLVNVAHTESLLVAMWQRSLLGLHLFTAREESPEAWLKTCFERWEPFEVDIDQYAKAYHRTPPDHIRRFIVDNNFYNAADPIIALARSIQRGQIDRSINIDAAVKAAATQSQYAQALRRGYLYLIAANEYFEGRIDEAELKSRSDLGKPHVPTSGKEE
jgi:hypothetical protein